jgi:hypothetical protein
MHIKMWHKMATTAAMAVLAGGALIGPAAASAQGSTTGLRNAVTNRCVDDSFAYGLRSAACNQQSFQTFDFNKQAAGVYALKNRATGRCVDDSFESGLRAFGCNGGAWQNWEVVYHPGAIRLLRNKATGRCLDDSSAGLRAFSCHGYGSPDIAYQMFSPLPI